MREQLVNHDKRVKHLGYSEINALLSKLVTFLDSSDKKTMKTYIYNNQIELIAV